MSMPEKEKYSVIYFSINLLANLLINGIFIVFNVFVIFPFTI